MTTVVEDSGRLELLTLRSYSSVVALTIFRDELPTDGEIYYKFGNSPTLYLFSGAQIVAFPTSGSYIPSITFYFQPDADFAGFAGDFRFRTFFSNVTPQYREYQYQFDVTSVEDVPRDISLDNSTIDENTQGSGVGILTTTDPDVGDFHTYQLVGDISGKFEIVGSTLRLREGVSLDYEEQSEYTIRVRSIDSTNRAVEKDITILVNDLNELLIQGTSTDDVIVGTVNAEEIKSGAGDDTVIAGGGNDIVRGAIGNDSLNGGEGHDWIDGGTGGDAVTGGEGADWFAFDKNADNNLDVVVDYDLGDFLYFANAADAVTPLVFGFNVVIDGVTLIGGARGNVDVVTQAGTAILNASSDVLFNVLNGGLDELATLGEFIHTIFDANNDEFFNKDINVYTTDGLDYRLVENDDGSSLLINLDQTNTNGWSQITTTKDTAGEITNVVTNLDTGAFFSKFFDVDGTQPWLTSTTGKTATNATDYQDITYDDNTRIFTDYDQEGTIPWTTALTNYNAAGQQVFRRVNFDDGRFEVTYEDFDSSQDWNTKIDTYTDGVNRDFVNFYNDDGTRKTVDFDQDTSQLWSTKEIFYNAGGAATSFIEYNDDGTRRSKVFDPDDAANWNEFLIVYDAAGAQDFRRDDYDLGENGLISYLVREFDNENTEVWDTRFREYDVDDNLLNEYFI